MSSHVVSGPKDPALPVDTESTHIITVSRMIDPPYVILSIEHVPQGVDKLHAMGIAGKGIKIGM